MTRLRACVTALTVVLLLIFVPSAYGAAGAPAPPAPPAPLAPTPFDAKAAIAALGSRSIVRMAGAPALFDQAKIGGLMKTTAVKLLLVPFGPWSTDADRAAEQAQVTVLQDWGDAHHVQLILVIGLEIHLLSEYVVVTPSNLTELRPVLENYDLTAQLVMSLDLIKNGRPDATPTPPTTARPASPAATVAAMAERLRSNDTAVVGGVPLTTDPQKLWRESIPHQRLRLVIEPPQTGDPGELAKPLSAQFPGDVVITIRGRWIEIAGPDQALLDSAVLYSYGAAESGFTAWAVTPDLLLNYIAKRIALLRSGSASGQASPAAAADPVRSVGRFVPALVVATALILLLVVVLLRRRRAAGLRAAARSAIRARGRVAGRLPGVAAGILALDGLAGSGTARDLLDSATERYGVARTIVLAGGSGVVAGSALDAATAELREAASLVKVPLPPGLDPA